MTDAQDVEPPINMLWESADPSAALRERFGFGSAGEAVDWVAGVLADHWGLRVDVCERLVLSDANCLAWVVVGGRRMIAKWSMRQALFARLAAIARLTSWLDERGVPVSAPRSTTDGRVQVEVDGFSLGLQDVVDGDLLDIADPAQVRAAGEMLATMHAVMADYPDVVPTDEPRAPRTQLVGNDFRSANVLWADGRIAAVLDLEEAGYGRRVDDLAQAAVLLGTRYHDWSPTPVGVRGAFVEAYGSILPLGRDEADALDGVIEANLRRMSWPG